MTNTKQFLNKILGIRSPTDTFPGYKINSILSRYRF